MLAISVITGGFEISFTEPLKTEITASDIEIQQWRYEATAAYGGPKIDLRQLPIRQITHSEDNTKINIQLSGLKTGHVIYFKLSDQLKSATDQFLWSGEAWYTLNRRPELHTSHDAIGNSVATASGENIFYRW